MMPSRSLGWIPSGKEESWTRPLLVRLLKGLSRTEQSPWLGTLAEAFSDRCDYYWAEIRLVGISVVWTSRSLDSPQ